MRTESVVSARALLFSQDLRSDVKDHCLIGIHQHALESDWARWTTLVQEVEGGSAKAESELCDTLIPKLRIYFSRQRRGNDTEDLAHDAVLIVLQAIRNKELRDPARLMGFVRTIAYRTLCADFRHAEHQCVANSEEIIDTAIDKAANPESVVLADERAEMVHEGFQALPELDRNILTRFYLRRESPETICKELELTANQFRLKKSRAKARVSKLTRMIRTRRRLTMWGVSARNRSLHLSMASPASEQVDRLFGNSLDRQAIVKRPQEG